MNAPADLSGLKMKIFARSFFVQSSWNFENLQNLGFAFMVYPFLVRRHSSSRDGLAVAFRRHLGFFNTHPYFAGLVAGAVIHEENRGGPDEKFPSELKQLLMSSLGSVGDSFFWASFRPFLMTAALVAALFGRWWAPLFFLTAYNAVHVAFRWWGVSKGLEQGAAVTDSIETLGLLNFVPPLSLSLAACAGFAAGSASLLGTWMPVQGSNLFSIAAGLGLFAAAAFFSRRGAPPWKVAAGLAAAAVLLELLVSLAVS